MNTAKKKARAWAKVNREAIKASKRIAYAKDNIERSYRYGGEAQLRRWVNLEEIIYYQTLRYERLKAKAKAFG